MRFSLPLILTLAAAAVEASPLPDAEPWCLLKGQPCWMSKRTAEAFIEATHARINEARDAEPWCLLKGQPCWKGKREAEAFIEASAGLATRDAEPWCLLKGQPCWKDKRSAEALFSAIKAGHMVRDPQPWSPVLEWGCLVTPCRPPPGYLTTTAHTTIPTATAAANPTHKARNAEPEAEPWCLLKGQPCWKSKRDADAFFDATHAQINEARDAEADAQPWCLLPGQPCWKSKREADAFVSAAARHETRDGNSKREAEALTAAAENGHFVDRRWLECHDYPETNSTEPHPKASCVGTFDY